MRPAGPISDQQVMAFAPVTSAGWGVVAAQSEGEILAPLRQLQWPLLWGSGILFAFALLFAWLAGRNVVRPLNRLMLACEGIAGGDLKRPVPAVGVGEIRRLASAFDTVRDRLAAALSEMLSWNAVLEERVQEKTEDLCVAQPRAFGSERGTAGGERVPGAGYGAEPRGADRGQRIRRRRGHDPPRAEGGRDHVARRSRPARAARARLCFGTRPRTVTSGATAGGTVRRSRSSSRTCRGEAEPACEALAAAGIGSLALVPLRFGERPVASLALAFRERRGFSSRDVGLLRSYRQPACACHRPCACCTRSSSERPLARLPYWASPRRSQPWRAWITSSSGSSTRPATLLGMEKAQLLFFGEDGMDTTVSVSAGNRTVRVAQQQPSREQGLGGLAVSTGAPVWTADYAADARFSHAAQEAAWAEGICSAIAVPLQAGSRVIGVLYVGSASANQFQEDDVSVLLGFASHAAIAIENARLFSEAGKVEALRELDTLRSQLVSTVSHELRTPLAGIKAYATALLRTDVKRSERMQREYLTAIDQDCDRLTTLVEESLDMSRIRAGMTGLNRELLSPAEVIDRAIAAIRPVAGAPRDFVRGRSRSPASLGRP